MENSLQSVQLADGKNGVVYSKSFTVHEKSHQMVCELHGNDGGGWGTYVAFVCPMELGKQVSFFLVYFIFSMWKCE